MKINSYLLNEIVEHLTLSDFFKMKLISTSMKQKLDSIQHLVLKREAFKTFCPHLFLEENPFRYVTTTIANVI